MGLCLGFDTSNYTTSAAVFDGKTAENRGRLLTVPDGTLGLRQSDALFQHTKRLHLMMEQLRADGVMGEIRAVGASTRPREVEGSYMPCFLVGEGQGKLFHERLFGSEKAAGHCPDHGTPKRVLRVTSGSARTQRPAPWRPGAGAGTAPRP